MSEPVEEVDCTIHVGSGNVFADVGYADAEEREAKVLISILIEQKIKGLGVEQVERLTGLSETELALIVGGVCGGISLERMQEALEVLDGNFEAAAIMRENGVTLETAMAAVIRNKQPEEGGGTGEWQGIPRARQTVKVAIARCPECRGTGRCLACKGTGNAAKTFYSAAGDCDHCLGYGWCQHCRGSAEDPTGTPAYEAPPVDVFAAFRELYGLSSPNVAVPTAESD